MSDSEANAAGHRVEAYLDTVERIEPEVTMIDLGYALASISISLKRIADNLELQLSNIDHNLFEILKSMHGIEGGKN